MIEYLYDCVSGLFEKKIFFDLLKRDKTKKPRLTGF